MKQCLYLVYLFLFAASSQVCAQQKEFIFKNFTQEEGLPSNEAYYVFEDSRHYIWIATDLGVVRYNGNKFEQFNLPDNVVFKIKEDRKGRIWFFTYKAQLAYFENEKIHLYQYNDSIKKNVGKINITDAFIDDDDNIIINSSRGFNYSITKNGRVTSLDYIHPATGTTIFAVNQIRGKKYFSQRTRYNSYKIGPLLIDLKRGSKSMHFEIPGYEGGFNHYGCTELNGSIYFFCGSLLIKLNEDGSFSKKIMPNHILCISEVAGDICIGMQKSGAIILNPDLSDAGQDLLSNKTVTCITPDSEGGLWFSTLENGLYYLKNLDIHHFAGGNQVFRLFNANDKFILFGTKNGIRKLEGEKETVYLNDTVLKVSDILCDKERNLYIAAAWDNNFRAKFKSKKDNVFGNIFLINTPYEIAFIGSDSLIFSGVEFAGIINTSVWKKNRSVPLLNSTAKNNTAEVIPLHPANFFTDSKNSTWATGAEGLFKLSSNFKTFDKFKPSSALLGKGITCIRQMKDGMLAAGIRFGGIALFNDTGIVANITETEGLLSNKIRYLMALDDQLWIATARGLSVIQFASYNPLRYKITNIGKNDGFYNITINHLVQYQHNILAATSDGIYSIENIGKLLSRQPLPIPFYINTISYFNGDTSGIKKITVPYEKNRVLIKYSAVCFNSAEEIKYQYRFEHADTNWHSTSNPELLLENLEPGTYTLEIKALIPKQQRYSSVQSLSIIVEKPWWQNNWFRLLAVLLIASGVYFYISNRIKNIKTAEKRKTALNARLTELEQTALRSQMNPHFIFNCLTSIQQLIVSGNKTDANEYLVKFARLIRKTLDLSAHPFISLREEKQYLDEYLFLEQLRLSSQFEYSILIEDTINTDKIFIPNMMIQPVVENCIRHGIKSLENKKGIVSISFSLSGRSITCRVTDNGVGRTDQSLFNEAAFTKHRSYGIDIIRKRLEAFSAFKEQELGIEIKDLYDKEGTTAGTEVILQLPYKNSI